MKTLERTQERVRNFVNQHSRAIFTLLVFFMLLGTAQVVEAQSGLKISSLSEVTDKAKEGADILANTLDKSQSLPSGHSQGPHIIYKISVSFQNL